MQTTSVNLFALYPSHVSIYQRANPLKLFVKSLRRNAEVDTMFKYLCAKLYQKNEKNERIIKKMKYLNLLHFSKHFLTNNTIHVHYISKYKCNSVLFR